MIYFPASNEAEASFVSWIRSYDHVLLLCPLLDIFFGCHCVSVFHVRSSVCWAVSFFCLQRVCRSFRCVIFVCVEFVGVIGTAWSLLGEFLCDVPISWLEALAASHSSGYLHGGKSISASVSIVDFRLRRSTAVSFRPLCVWLFVPRSNLCARLGGGIFYVECCTETHWEHQGTGPSSFCSVRLYGGCLLSVMVLLNVGSVCVLHATDRVPSACIQWWTISFYFPCALSAAEWVESVLKASY